LIAKIQALRLQSFVKRFTTIAAGACVVVGYSVSTQATAFFKSEENVFVLKTR
jgi:hypothetical protein